MGEIWGTFWFKRCHDRLNNQSTSDGIVAFVAVATFVTRTLS